MNLKDTLNLPKTDFPMRADLVNREPSRIKQWEDDNVYAAIQQKYADAKPFILHDGPPFTNGYVHIGTALNKILKDIIIRYKSMRGYRTPYIPGWDCHGLPIEHKVVKELRASGRSFTPSELRKECASFSKKFISKQREQFKRLGILADWEHDYRTMDPEYERTILHFFADCISQGLVYRSKKPVYWSIPCKTALAEAEVEYQEHVSPSIWVKFKFDDDSMAFFESSVPVYAVIWTTTPWTLPSNMAIAIHPELTYVIIESNGERYLICESRVEDFLKTCNISDHSIVKTYKGSDLEGLATSHPFISRTSKIVLANYVTTDTGTGCVHIAPGHGLEDYNTGLAYKLDVYCPLDDDGKYINDGQVPEDLVGISVLDNHGHCDANEKVIKKLSECDALMAQQRYVHQYPHCWRSKTPVIFRAMAQWFIALDKNGLRQEMQNAVDNVNWVPSWGENRIRAAIDSRTDWCISRQRAWGTPLPIFYNESGEPLLDESVVRGIADKIGQYGSDYWFTASETELLDGISLPDGWDVNNLKKSTDSLDVWIDSGNSHRAVLEHREELSWPADIYFEGSDQHRGWFQSSMWTSVIYKHQGAPFRNVLTHGFIVGADKKKISKSDGKPQTADDYINKYGADVIRLWISSENFRSDITISDDIINHVSSTYRTIRNTLRFQIGNLYDFDVSRHEVSQKEMTVIDIWALQKCKQLISDITKAYEEYDFHRVYQLINRFCSVELSAIYHDILKDRLYTFASNSYERRSSQTAIFKIFNVLIRLLAPIITFTCDEALSFFVDGNEHSKHHVQLLEWPLENDIITNNDAERDVDGLLSFKQNVNEQLEHARKEKLIGQSLDAKVTITISSSDIRINLLKKYLDILPEIFIVSQVGIVVSESDSVCSIDIAKAEGQRCPRSWKWVNNLIKAGEFGMVSQRSYDALKEKYPELVK